MPTATRDTVDAATGDGVVFAMPSLGADMTEGRITEWLVHPGDTVTRGQIVVVVETDKSDIEVEVFEAGTIVELLVDEGELVPVGTPIARIARPAREHAEPAPPPRPATAPETAPVTAAETVPVTAAETVPAAPPAAERHAQVRVPAGSHITSPVIRHLAEELHVAADRIDGTGPGGRVRRQDVEAAAHRPTHRITPRARRLMHEHGITHESFAGGEIVTGDDVLAILAAPPAPAPPVPAPRPAAAAERPTRAETMRRHIADLMTRSWSEIPHYHVARRLDLGRLVERLAVANEHRPLAERVVAGAVLLSAAARAAAKVPACNGWWRDDRFEQADHVHLGVVLSLRGGGIVVPTIHDADQLAPGELMARLSELVQRARQGRLRASDMTEASITVTNLGDLGADSVSGVIHPPQVVIVGFGAVHDEVWAVDGEPVVRPTVHASLAGDHRAIDGMTGSRYLAQLQTLLDGNLLEEL